MLALPNQRRGALAEYGISRAEGDRAVWAVGRDGTRWEGAAAVNRVLYQIGGGWGILASVFRPAPMAAIEELFYGWFSRHRSKFHRLGVRPECDETGADCE